MSDNTPTIALLCGSTRTGSINVKLQSAIATLLHDMGAGTQIINLADYDLPLMQGDIEAPDSVQKLIDDIKACDGVVVTSPEYNGSLPPLLKNAIDWTSIVDTSHIKGPVYAVASCTPGPMSGIMVMRQMQFILMRLGANLVPYQLGVGNASTAFNDDGSLANEKTENLAKLMLSTLLDRVSRQ